MGAAGRVPPPSPSSPAVTLAIPKSSTLSTSASPSRSARKRLAGLTSRWMMPRAWAFSRPRQACTPMRRARSAGMGPSRWRSCCTSSPTRYSMARKGAPEASSRPTSRICTMCSDSMAPAARASSSKRVTRRGSSTSPAVITLSATRRPVPVWRASYTVPIPPSPSGRTMTYLPPMVCPITRRSRIAGNVAAGETGTRPFAFVRAPPVWA
jgi:hypothetical protein